MRNSAVRGYLSYFTTFMSRRHPTIHVGLQPPEDNIDIPPLLPPRQKTSRFALYSRSHCSQPCSLPETPSSQNLSQAASRLELVCTTETCNNSESCMRTLPDFCPEGLKEERKESGQCSDSCQNRKASNAGLGQDHSCTKETCSNSPSCMRTYLENLERIKKESRQCSESCQNKIASSSRLTGTYGSPFGHATPQSRPRSVGTTCDATCRHSTRGTKPSSDRRTCGEACESRPSRATSFGLSTESRTHRASSGHSTRELRPSSDDGACPPAIILTTVRQSESLLRMMSTCCESNRSRNSRSECPIKSSTKQPSHKQFIPASTEMKTSCCPPTKANLIETYPPEQRVNNAYSDMPRVERSCCKEPDPIIRQMDSPTRCLMDTGTQSAPATKTTSTCAMSKTKQVIHNKHIMPDIEEDCKSACMRSPAQKQRTGPGCYMPPEPCQNSGVGRNLQPEPDVFVAPVKGESILDNTKLRNELIMKLKKVCCEEDIPSPNSCCNKKDSKVKKGLSEDDKKVLEDICREDMVLEKSPSNENVKEKKITCPCPEIEEPQEVQKKCSCHFPPAFNQYGCTGNISGTCNCASGD